MKMRLIVIALFLGSIVFGASSCSKFLSEEPDQSLNEDSLFANLSNVRSYLAQIYANIPDPYANRFNSVRSGPYNMIADDANWISQSGFPSTVWSYSTASASVSIAQTLWGEWYKPIRNATDFIAKIDNANPDPQSGTPASLRMHYKGEARAMRAIYYFWLLRTYGPVVILPDLISVSASNDELMKERTPFDSCVNYITNELDQAYDEIQASGTGVETPLLGNSGEEYGRITTGICKAYKEQVLMLSASPLFNGNSMYVSLKNQDGTALINTTYDANKWKKAADAAKAFIDEFVPSVYDLYTVSDTNAYMAAYKACRDVVTTSWNKEWIYAKSQSGNVGYYYYSFTPKLVGWSSSVVSQGGGYGAVNQSLVDAYFTKNGLSIAEDTTYVASGFSSFKAPFDVQARSTFNQWINREPRFYVGVTYNNSYWLNQGTSTSQVVVDMTYSGNSGAAQSTTDHSSTGYLIRKNITSSSSSRGWVYLRLAQIYLDYAEALNEYDPGNSDILKYLNLIRKRAGIPTYGSTAGEIAAPSGQSAVREAIRKERRVELAHEEVRYFDLRRWMTATTVLNEPVYGMNVYANGNDFYTKTLEFQPRFQARDYLWPIPSLEIRRDSKLVQNPGW